MALGATLPNDYGLSNAALYALDKYLDYQRRLREGTVEDIELNLRGPMNAKEGFAKLVAKPDTTPRQVRESLFDYPTLRIEEQPCALEGLTIEYSDNLPNTAHHLALSNIRTTRKIRIVGSNQLTARPVSERFPRYK